jgi:hypothetical protein
MLIRRRDGSPSSLSGPLFTFVIMPTKSFRDFFVGGLNFKPDISTRLSIFVIGPMFFHRFSGWRHDIVSGTATAILQSFLLAIRTSQTASAFLVGFTSSASGFV